ncbi:hypothetical protein [Paludisphaera sp.]|uniref:hypothetical protein n=1 Tax=Paludisphaera sp. TaxID=2017432 RepID=UPI00301BA8F0
MAIDHASNPAAEGSFGRAMLFVTLWLLACAAVVVALDVILGPSSRRYAGGAFVWVGLLGGFVIARLAWTPTGTRAKETPKDDPLA